MMTMLVILVTLDEAIWMPEPYSLWLAVAQSGLGRGNFVASSHPT